MLARSLSISPSESLRTGSGRTGVCAGEKGKLFAGGRSRCILRALQGEPPGAVDIHQHEVHAAALDSAYCLEPALGKGFLGSDVPGQGVKVDTLQVQLGAGEQVVPQGNHSIAPVAFAPVFLVADDNAQLSLLLNGVVVVVHAISDVPALVGLYAESAGAGGRVAQLVSEQAKELFVGGP